MDVNHLNYGSRRVKDHIDMMLKKQGYKYSDLVLSPFCVNDSQLQSINLNTPSFDIYYQFGYDITTQQTDLDVIFNPDNVDYVNTLYYGNLVFNVSMFSSTFTIGSGIIEAGIATLVSGTLVAGDNLLSSVYYSGYKDSVAVEVENKLFKSLVMKYTQLVAGADTLAVYINANFIGLKIDLK